MIRALSRDALRQLLRGQAFWLIVAVGGLIGLFVRATRATGSDHLIAEDPHGDAIDTWIAGLFLASLIQAVVAGLLLATEDRETGLLQQVAIRPVPRLRYAIGRIAGLTLGVASALLLLTVISAPVSGLSRKDLPEIRDLMRAEKVEFNGESVPLDVPIRIGQDDQARFEFGAEARPEAELRLNTAMVKLISGEGGFDGRVHLQVSYVPTAGARVDGQAIRIRPFQTLPIRFPAPSGVPFALEVTVLDPGYLLEIDRESLMVLGEKVSFASQIVVAFILLLAASAMIATIAFLFGTGLSLGPASLAAGFVLVIGLSRQALLDIIAGIGRHVHQGEAVDPGFLDRFVRSFLNVIVRMVPDLSRFNPSDVIGAAEALRVGPVGVSLAAASVTVIACGFLVALVLPLKVRS